MSLRLSAVRPFACSGLMYAAVPSSTPTPVIIAGDVIVGDIDSGDGPVGVTGRLTDEPYRLGPQKLAVLPPKKD
jgi:hypothetical protein